MTVQDSDIEQTEKVADVASHDGDTRPDSPQNRPLPTDSMITVRLSDSSHVTQLDTSTPRTSIPGSNRKSIRFSQPPVVEDNSSFSENDEAIMDEDVEARPVSDARRESITSLSSIRDCISQASEPSSGRSRSDSSGTLSSNGSAQVDWDELDKSEEQAPRDQGSDEVRCRKKVDD